MDIVFAFTASPDRGEIATRVRNGFGRSLANCCRSASASIHRERFIAQWVMRQDSQFFENPDVFDPDRWTNNLQKRIPIHIMSD
ncbi:hypothetical protein CEN47_04085 [Fischerella thermalis CCMEE 5319]|nr:hypothetical protein CEN47_04085 [Fischerella thermalis CCMEE 5319]